MLRTTCVTLIVASIGLAPTFALAQQIRQKILQNPHAVINDFIAAKNRIPPLYPPDPVFDTTVSGCLYTESSQTASADDQFVDLLESIAWRYKSIADGLARAGYPRAIWHQPLSDLVHAQIDEIARRRPLGVQSLDINAINRATRDYQLRVVRAVNNYRLDYAPSLRKASAEGTSCGGDYIGYVKIRSNPVSGLVKVINEFKYKLCELSDFANRSAFSDQCNMWDTARPDLEFPQGTYYYYVKWGNGNSECHKVKLTYQASDVTPTFTVKPTNQACNR
jgi:hypothetical protein